MNKLLQYLKIIITLVGLLIATNINAQKINISIPKDIGKEYYFILNHGLDVDTIQQGTINFAGGVTINIPQNYKGYRGMASLKVKDGLTTQMVVNNENFSIEIPENDKPRFTNSKENDLLYNSLKVEPKQLDSIFYAPQFVDILRYVQLLNEIIYQNKGGLFERSNALIYGTDKLDIDALYTSGLWFYAIDGIIKLSGDQETIGNNMVSVLKRVKSPEVFEALSKNLIMITDEFGFDDAFDIIVPYIQQSGRIEVPTGTLYTAFALAKIQKGSVVPPISGLKQNLDNEKTLFVFYQPDCSNCEVQMAELIDKYPQIKEKGVRVVTISASYDKKENELENERFPWKDTVCDFKGFAGVNFINYGISSTPTFFLVDKDQKLIKRFALVSDIFKYID